MALKKRYLFAVFFIGVGFFGFQDYKNNPTRYF